MPATLRTARLVRHRQGLKLPAVASQCPQLELTRLLHQKWTLHQLVITYLCQRCLAAHLPEPAGPASVAAKTLQAVAALTAAPVRHYYQMRCQLSLASEQRCGLL
jgi:hypothetical protein